MSEFVLHEETRAGIEAYREKRALRHAEMAKLLKLSSPTRYTKYVNLNKSNNKAEHDADVVQSACRRFLRHEAHKNEFAANLFENAVSKEFAAAMATVIHTADLSLTWGPAGGGKTSGAVLWCVDHPETIMITASRECRDSKAIRNMVFERLRFEANSKGETYNNTCSRWHWITSLLQGSERPIIIDAGERLTLDALEWCCDLNDLTKTPIMFVANVDLLEVARRSDRVSSRIGKVTEIKIDTEEEETAKKLIEKYAPDSGDRFVDAVVALLSEGGQARRATKHLRLAALIYSQAKRPDWDHAWKAAEGQLLKPNKFAQKK
jgi:DNA transposition AAA+ family ATPase